mgnify:CR=1 FL=1
MYQENHTGELRYYDNNIFKKPATNVFVYGSIAGKEENTVEENLKYTRKYFDVKDDEEINLCAAGSKEESLKTLQELDERKMYIGYVSLDKIMSYADFKKYVDKQEFSRSMVCGAGSRTGEGRRRSSKLSVEYTEYWICMQSFL